MPTVRPEALDERLPDDDLVVVDVRDSARFEADHVPGSRNVPVYDDLRRGDPAAFERVADVAPEDGEVVTVCRVGVVADRATEHLRAEGYAAATLAGGMRDWRGYRDDTLGYRLRSWLRGLLS